jgi:mercuric ion binding protein
MKNLLLAMKISFFMLFSMSFAQTSVDTLEFKVTGNCTMCKKTIEASLNGKPGIKTAIWNKDTKMIKVVFDPTIITTDKIHHSIAAAGYDTENKRASDKAYKALPGCCQYKRTLHEK